MPSIVVYNDCSLVYSITQCWLLQLGSLQPTTPVIADNRLGNRVLICVQIFRELSGDQGAYGVLCSWRGRGLSVAREVIIRENLEVAVSDRSVPPARPWASALCALCNFTFISPDSVVFGLAERFRRAIGEAAPVTTPFQLWPRLLLPRWVVRLLRSSPSSSNPVLSSSVHRGDPALFFKQRRG